MAIRKREDPQNAKTADLFAALEVMAEAPLSLTDGSSSQRREKKKKKKKKAESLTRANALAWRKPFCTTAGGADHHTEALASSWHRPDPRLSLVSDSPAGARQA